MSSVQEIYNELFAGMTVTVHLPSKKDFETLRTSLCKKNQMQVMLDLSDGSVVATYDEDKQEGTFTLGPSKRKLAQSKWAVIRVE